jgi:leucyl-tRNA synthetase
MIVFAMNGGPPYANGRIPLGAALNRILKGFIVKMGTLDGFNTPYLQGWDCHALPIEIIVDKELAWAQPERGFRLKIALCGYQGGASCKTCGKFPSHHQTPREVRIEDPNPVSRKFAYRWQVNGFD